MTSRVINSKVRGVTFDDRQKMIAKTIRPGRKLIAIRDRRNAHDRSAIGLWLRSMKLLIIPSKTQVGWIGHDLAVELASYIDSGGALSVKVANITGGGGGESLGINIEIRKKQQSAIGRFSALIWLGALGLCALGVGLNVPAAFVLGVIISVC